MALIPGRRGIKQQRLVRGQQAHRGQQIYRPGIGQRGIFGKAGGNIGFHPPQIAAGGQHRIAGRAGIPGLGQSCQIAVTRQGQPAFGAFQLAGQIGGTGRAAQQPGSGTAQSGSQAARSFTLCAT